MVSAVANAAAVGALSGSCGLPMFTHEGEDVHDVMRVEQYAYANPIDGGSTPHLKAISMVGTDAQIKAVMATIRAGDKSRNYFRLAGKSIRIPEKYLMRHAVINPRYREVNLVIREDSDRVVLGTLEESVESYLLSKSSTTPFLPEWVPYIAHEMQSKNGIRALTSFGCDGWEIGEFDDKELDAIIENGLLRGKLKVCDGKVTSKPMTADSPYVSLANYLNHYGPVLVESTVKSSKPIHHAGDIKYRCETLREPYQAQWDVIESMCKCWDDGSGLDSLLLSGEVGTGKTLCGAVAVHAHAKGRPYRAIISCPSHLTHKWEREIRATIPGDIEVSILTNYKDLAKLVGVGRAKKPEFYIMSDSRSKLGSGWEPAYVRQSETATKKYIQWINDNVRNPQRRERLVEEAHDTASTIHCPCCNAMIKKKVKKAANPYSAAKAVWVPAEPKDLNKNQMFCEFDIDGEQYGCGSALFQNVRQVDRWPLSDFISRKLKYFFNYYICDEAHECKSATSASGNAFATMVNSTKRHVAMTGTVLNGYAESVFPMLYRMSARDMQNLGLKWNDSMKFSKMFGRIETVTSYEVNYRRANRVSKGKITGKTVKVRPGIMPTLYGDCMMPRTIFLQLEDLGVKLPEQTEHLHPVTMDEELDYYYKELEDDIRNEIAGMLRSGSKAAMSVMLNTLLGWSDHPFDFNEVGYHNEDGVWTTVAKPAQLNPDVIRNKEIELAKVVAEIANRGRQSWVYVQMSQKRDIQPRLVQQIKAMGLDVRVLNSKKVPTDEREAWIAKNKSADVIISHPALVKTGLDLFSAAVGYNFSSLVWYQSGYILDTFRQASGRARRIGQWQDCELHYLYYLGTMQEKAAILMAEKAKAAAAIDGRFSSGGLMSLAGGTESAEMMLVRSLYRAA